MDSSLGIAEGAVGYSREKLECSVDGLLECGTCGQCFTTKEDFKRHDEVMHKDEEQHSCTICSEQFATRESLILHLLVHSGNEAYACPFCDKKFTLKTDLSVHKRVHKTEITHPCHLCPATFSYRCNLKLHVALHKGEKPHKCPVCETTYVRRVDLNAHMRKKHDGVKATVASTGSRIENALPSDAVLKLPPGMMNVDIKVEPSSSSIVPSLCR
uniref:Putative zinc finger protein n=1 Tax=Rhipicephalus pulchellus TaxID=72859 RepID=L7LYA0_RHIPC